MVRTIFLTIGLLLSFVLTGREIPQVSLPVTDEVGILTNAEVSALNRRLIDFSDSTSNQIAILITTDIGEGDISEFTIAFGQKNGPGQKGVDNGVAIVIVPKTSRSRGQMFIATGYGVEGIIPDALAGRLVDYEFIPFFKRGDYYSGIKAGTDVIMKLLSKEISVKQYKKRRGGGANAWVVLLILGVVLFFMFSKGRRAQEYARKNDLPFWIAMGLLNNSGRSHRGYFSDFSGGSGPFGGGGGFGGFGGGGFGGGGAGGSW